MKRFRLLIAAAALAFVGAAAVPAYACPNCDKHKTCDCQKQGKKCSCGDKCNCAKKQEDKPVKK